MTELLDFNVQIEMTAREWLDVWLALTGRNDMEATRERIEEAVLTGAMTLDFGGFHG